MISELARILERGRSETTELRAPQASLEALGRDVCALLNQQGGVIVWGVSSAGNVVGLPDAEEQARTLTDYVAQRVRPRPLVSISVETSAEGQVVMIDVPPGSDKPYSVAGEIWIRIAKQSLRATPDENTELVERAAVKLERWEREPLPGFSLEACDADELQRTRSDFEKAGRFGVAMPDKDDELLRHLNLFRSGQYTNGCAVLFARKARAWAPNVALRISMYSQPSRESLSWDNMLEGPAVALVQEAVDIIQQRTGFAGRFGADALQREDRPAYAVYALREGLVNAVVHRDYAGLGYVQVEIFPEHLDIHNPGELPEGWTLDQLRRDHLSKPTNPDIAQAFYLRGFMDQLGMGAQRLIAECRKLGARAPSWSLREGTVSLRVFRAPVVAPLSPRQARFVEQSKRGRSFVLSDYARSAKVSERQARRDLQELNALGIVERRGKGPATSYQLRAKAAATSDKEAIESAASMERWFFERYDQAWNAVPYVSSEGGYQYVAGGPYDAEEELTQAFGGRSKKIDQMIKEVAKQLSSAGAEWVKRGQY